LKYAEPLLADLPRVAQVEEPKSYYVGGDHRVMADTGVCSLYCFSQYLSIHLLFIIPSNAILSVIRELVSPLHLNFLVAGSM